MSYIAGGNWDNGVIAGSRAVNVNNYPWNVNTYIGARFACDFRRSFEIAVSEQTATVTHESQSSSSRQTAKERWAGRLRLAHQKIQILLEHGLFDRICDYGNLLLSWKKTCRLKKYRPDMMEFRNCLDENLIIIQNELLYKHYVVSPYINFIIYEPKKRTISSLPVKDRIVQHALVNVIEPVIDKQFIYDSHACRKGRGLKTAIDRFVKFSKKNKYCLKCDISSFFPTINHVILKDIFRKKIQCNDTLWLIDTIINSTDSPGLPIGNLLSQLSANLYLNELDRYVKHEMKYKFYIRYMDDFVLFSNNISELRDIRNTLRYFLHSRLSLVLSERKSTIYETAKGVDYCGFRCYPSHAVVKKATRYKNYRILNTLMRDLTDGRVKPEEFTEKITSIIGHSSYSRNYSYRSRMAEIIAGGSKCIITK